MTDTMTATKKYEQAIEHVRINVIMAVDQIDEHESAADAFWAYRRNLNDTLDEQKLQDCWLEAMQEYDTAWLSETNIKIEYIHE